MATTLNRQPAARPVPTETRTNAGGHDGQGDPERFDVIVIGGGQAGLAAGYHLARHKLSFVILDGNDRVGDSWRKRWDTLRVFTAARYNSLPGADFPAPPNSFPTKDDVAAFLEAYALRMDLPVRNGVNVERVSRMGAEYIVTAGSQSFESAQVVIATGAYHYPRVPAFAADLGPRIRQFHASEFRNPSQLQEGHVLVVGASNSGAEIAHIIAGTHRTWLSGRDTGKIPFRSGSRTALAFDRVFWFAANNILTVNTPFGRKARPYMRDRGAPLERVKPADLAAAGVERVYARTVGVKDGLPLLDDGRVLDVANVIWCTGFRQDFNWIQLPIVGEDGWPLHKRGVVPTAPGLYFMGLPFMHSFASPLIGGVGRDAEYIANQIVSRAKLEQRRTTVAATLR
jgi:putative flavoprotein involved in K+ transport